jgi:hypothetical protein
MVPRGQDGPGDGKQGTPFAAVSKSARLTKRECKNAGQGSCLPVQSEHFPKPTDPQVARRSRRLRVARHNYTGWIVAKNLLAAVRIRRMTHDGKHLYRRPAIQHVAIDSKIRAWQLAPSENPSTAQAGRKYTGRCPAIPALAVAPCHTGALI